MPAGFPAPAREQARVAALERLAAGRTGAGGAAPATRAVASPRARDKAGPAPLVPQGATVDARIRSLMRDPRYWRDRDEGLQNHVMRQWERAYPGTSLHAGFSRPDPIPAIEPDAVEAWPPEATPLPAPHRDGPLHPRPAVINPEFVWNAETGRWERDPAHRPGRGSPSAPAPQPLTAAAPSDADAPGPHSGPGPNSGRTREAALDALREHARETGMDYGAYLEAQHRIRETYPDEAAAPGVQVAQAGGVADAPPTAADVIPDRKSRRERREALGRLEPRRFIPANARNYARMDEILNSEEGAIRSRWFKAAADVTGLFGVGAADALNAGVLSDADEAFLRYTHHALASENHALFEALRAGAPPDDLKGLSGKALDYALVEREQALLQDHIEAYFKDRPPELRRAVMESLSRAADPTSVWGKARMLAMETAVEKAMNQAFRDGGYDFARQSHREALGKAMIDRLYAGAD
ncbi:MAG: hypothetical protein NXI21_18960 [Alphaproteobacteria bacterium]|nr:hypothetical protein [Alphaproteobacteria bacterium]